MPSPAKYLGGTAAIAVAFDSVMVLLFAVYLAAPGPRRESRQHAGV